MDSELVGILVDIENERSSISLSGNANDSLGSFEVPHRLEESSIENDVVTDIEENEIPTEVTYEIIADGSQKGKEILADSDGYTYTVKTRRANGNRVWTCSVCNKNTYCKASVSQKGKEFSRGCNPHAHPGKLGAATTVRVTTAVKKSCC